MSGHRLVLLAMVQIVVSQGAAAQYASGRLGAGVRSATGEARSTCVSVASSDISPVDAIVGHSFRYSLHYLESQEDVREALDISLNAAARGMWGSASAAVEYAKSLEVNQYGLFMMIRGSVISQPVIARASADPTLLLGTNGRQLKPRDVLRKCGDHFVSSIQYGGAVYATVAVNTRSSTEKERLRLDLQASFAAGFSVDAASQRTFERILRNSSYSITYQQEGGSQAIGVPSSLDGIDGFFRWARAAETEILRAPIAMRLETSPLTSVYPELDLPSTGIQPNVIRRAARVALDAKDLERSIAFVSRNPQRYPNASPAQLAQWRGEVRELGDEATFLVEDCISNEALCSSAALQELQRRWGALSIVLPSEDPLYGVFDFATYTEDWRGFGRNEGCRDRWRHRMKLGNLEIPPDRATLNFYFSCERIEYCYDCGGGWDCNTPDANPRWTGRVTADLSVEDSRLRIENVMSPGALYGASCEQELLRFIQSKDGASVNAR